MLLVVLLGPLCIDALADGFSDRQVQIDGINSQGTLNDQKDLEFLGLGLWNGPVKLVFNPSVMTRYSLGAAVETVTGEIMGKYGVKFKLTPKNGKVNNQNLKIAVKDRWGNELEGEVMLTGEAAGVAIEVATTKKPHEFRVSYVPSP
jgi:hypothetical protein